MTLTNEVLLYAATHTTEELNTAAHRMELLVDGFEELYYDPALGTWDERAHNYWKSRCAALDLYNQLESASAALQRVEPPFDPD